MLDIVLFQPEIPPNTGNIIRLCANTGMNLHLIKPLGFTLDDRRLKRAGLDYHEWANLRTHSSFQDYQNSETPNRLFAFTTRGTQRYDSITYSNGDALIFGPETRGLPQDFLDSLPTQQCLYLPQAARSRSLNLSNTVSIAVYEAWRQLNFV